MTKEGLIKKIIEVSKSCDTDEEFETYLSVTLDLLQPEDRDRFAIWGEDRSTPENCWKN